jgi:hypothetical protein
MTVRLPPLNFFHVTLKLTSMAVLMIIASVAAVFFSAACLAGYHYGLGNHLWKLTPNVVDLPAAVSKIVICIFSSIIPYNTALCFSKLSICASYLRHFTDRWIRRSIMFTAVVLISLCISIIFATIFNCLPVASDWDYSIRGICSDPRPTFYAGATVTIITDLFLCILPLPILWKLHLPIAQKCVVCILFSMGTLYGYPVSSLCPLSCFYITDVPFSSSIASIIRMTYLHNMGSFDIGCEYPIHALPISIFRLSAPYNLLSNRRSRRTTQLVSRRNRGGYLLWFGFNSPPSR